MTSFGFMTFNGGNAGPRSNGAPPPASGAAAIFGGQPGSAAATYNRAVQTFAPGSSNLNAMLSGQRNYASNLNRGYGTGVGAALLHGHAIGDADKGNNAGNEDMSHPAQTVEYVNAPICQFRLATAGSSFEMPSEREVAFFHKSRAIPERASIDALRPGVGMSNKAAASIALNDGFDPSASLAYHAAALNHILVTEQLNLLKTQPSVYYALRGRDIWHGVPELIWTGWNMLGPVRLEEMFNSEPSSKFNDGAQTLGGQSRGARGMKNLTVVMAGKCELQDYTNSSGITPGSSLGYMFTKVPLQLEERKAFFTLTGKSGTLIAGQSGVNTAITIPSPAEFVAMAANFPPASVEHALLAGITEEFCPWQLVPFADPDGGSPNHLFYRQTDEWARESYDALALRVGRVLFPPYKSHDTPAVESRDDINFRPVQNAAAAMGRMILPGVLIDPYKDGLLSLF